MKAAISSRFGPPDVVRIGEAETPVPAPGELLVRVRAATVNRTDCAYRSGKPLMMRLFAGMFRPKADILGTEFAGTVEAVGSDVDGFEVGDRVCGYCEGTFGAHAEYMTVAQTRLLARIPQHRTYAEAAPSMEGSHYALAYLRLAAVEPGQSVLVYGATGAIGSAAVQLAKLMGASVTAVCASEHAAAVLGIGADRVVCHDTEDFTVDEQRYDLVLDAVGKTSYRACRGLLAPRGVFSASEGWLTIGRSLIGRLRRHPRVIFPFPRRDPEGIRFLVQQIESGGFAPLIDRTYDFADVAEAYRYVETGQKRGSVVLDIDRATEVV